MRPRFAPVTAAAALALSACAAPEVRIAYPQPQTPSQEAMVKALSQVFLDFPQPAEGLKEFAAGFDAALAARGGSVLAYRAAPAVPDGVRESLSPSAVVTITFEPLSVVRADTVREVKGKDAQGKETVTKVPYVKRTARLPVQLSLTSADPAVPRCERAVSAEFSEERTREDAARTDDAAWLRKASAKLMRAAGRKAGAALPAPRLVEHRRPVFIDSQDKASKEAAEHAFKGAWEAASALWAARVDDGRGGWRDLWDLALAAESRRVYPEAERLYRLAQERAGGDPEAAPLRFDEVLSDLSSGARLLARSEAAAAYFGRPTAVLPFSDDTTSVDGPANLRRLVAEALTDGGWSVIPSDEVDAALRRNGFSQGGQLKKTTPAKLASWTDADRLVFGHIDEFRNIMLGSIGRRLVAGTLRVWDAASRADAHLSEKKAETTEVAGPNDAGARFSAQLGKALVENLRGKPLAEESASWVERVLQGLPLRPPPRR
ncbi:MAG: DUF799 family lipoprotein [Elusimicrobia bacterium]|nr:DUF799 family lipoprotein [Elusimicrobiota bacterium]